MNLAQFVFGLLRDIERIGLTRRNGVKLRLQPFEGELGICLTAAGSQRSAAYDKLFVADNDRDIIKNMLKCVSAAHHHRLVLGLTVGFRHQDGTGGLDLGHFPVQIFYKSGDSFRLDCRGGIIVFRHGSFLLHGIYERSDPSTYPVSVHSGSY